MPAHKEYSERAKRSTFRIPSRKYSQAYEGGQDSPSEKATRVGIERHRSRHIVHVNVSAFRTPAGSGPPASMMMKTFHRPRPSLRRLDAQLVGHVSTTRRPCERLRYPKKVFTRGCSSVTKLGYFVKYVVKVVLKERPRHWCTQWPRSASTALPKDPARLYARESVPHGRVRQPLLGPPAPASSGGRIVIGLNNRPSFSSCCVAWSRSSASRSVSTPSGFSTYT